MKLHAESPAPAAPPPPSKLRFHLSSFITFFLLFSCGYTLGFLSSSPPKFQPPIHEAPQQPNCTETVVSNPNPNSIPIRKTESPPPPHDLLWFRTRCADPILQSEILQTIMENMFEGVNPYSNFPSSEISSLTHKPAAHPRGWGSTKAVFRDLIESVRPKIIIELGAFLGASALHMAAITRNLSLTDTVILSIDDFRGWPGFRRRFRRDVPANHNGDAMLLQQFMVNVVAAGEAEHIMPVPASTGSALTSLCEWGVYADLIEVDAGHDFHSAWADINRAYALLRPGGILFGHDYFTAADDRGVRRAVTLFAKVNGLTIRPHGEHWVLSPKPSRNH